MALTAVPPLIAAIAEQWFVWTVAVVLGRVAYLIWKHNVRTSMIWFVKVVTDPLTDIMAYSPRYLTTYKSFLPSQARNREGK